MLETKFIGDNCKITDGFGHFSHQHHDVTNMTVTEITSFGKNGDKISSIFCSSISITGGANMFSAATTNVNVRNRPILIFEYVFILCCAEKHRFYTFHSCLYYVLDENTPLVNE